MILSLKGTQKANAETEKFITTNTYACLEEMAKCIISGIASGDLDFEDEFEDDEFCDETSELPF